MSLLQRIDWYRRGVKVWQPANVYLSASLGNNVSVGMFSEIGSHVKIGNNTRVGMGSFIPEGVVIGEDCFIGPKVCFVHDKLLWNSFPKGKTHWMQTVVGSKVIIGANALICPGLVIGRGALIGIGSVVTKDVGPNEVWFGNPAKFIRYRRKEDGQG